MTPQTGNVGTQVTLSITYNNPQTAGNYEVLWSLTQLFNGEETKVIKDGTISNGATSVTAQITVPESRYGIHFIQFKPDNGSNFINFQFSVLPKLQVNPSSALSGSVVSIYGNGFPANDIAIFKFDTQFLQLDIPTTKTGSFAGQIVIPTLPAGKYELTAITQIVSHSALTTVEILPVVSKSEDTDQADQDTKTTVPADSTSTENTANEPERDKIAPSPPAPISPIGNRIGIIGSQPVTIQWAEVSDKNGVAYTIEINKNRDFSADRSIRGAGLTNTYYTTMLQPGTYYWRVKATDSAGNESHWAYAPYAFKVGELSILIEEFGEVLNNNGEIVMIVICSLGAFIVLSAIVSSIRSLTKPNGK